MKVLSSNSAAALIESGWTVTIGGFGHCGSPEALLSALESRFLSTGLPNMLTAVFASGVGDRADRGVNRLAHAGLTSRVIGGFWALAPKLSELVQHGQLEAHNWPQGVVSHMFRAVAGGLPGVLTQVGIGTFIEPAQRGGLLNDVSSKSLVDSVELDGRACLLYKAVSIDCALLRGTYADEFGNISMEQEAVVGDSLAQALASRNSGGIVVVQVLGVVAQGVLDPKLVKIPGFLVDYVVVADDPSAHCQTYGEPYNAAYCNAGGVASGQGLVPQASEARSSARTTSGATCMDSRRIDARKVVARRAALELIRVSDQRGSTAARRPLVVNLGIGMPEGIPSVAQEYGVGADWVFTVESGAVGGTVAGGSSFGASAYPHALITQAEIFDLYDGGGIDLAFLGVGQIDGEGRVNVCSLDGRVNGVGGFINISQAAQQLVFCGSFTARGPLLDYVADKGLSVHSEGRVDKFVRAVSHTCYDPGGRARCRTPLLITERAVFSVGSHGLELVEVARGIDVTNDIVAHCAFELSISPTLALMPDWVFGDDDLSSFIAGRHDRLASSSARSSS